MVPWLKQVRNFQSLSYILKWPEFGHCIQRDNNNTWKCSAHGVFGKWGFSSPHFNDTVIILYHGNRVGVDQFLLFIPRICYGWSRLSTR